MRTRARSRIAGVPVAMHGPADAARHGIGIIHQELEVIDTLDVAGNVFLGREPHWAGPLRLLDRRRMEADTERQLARIGAQVSPRTVVGRLSTAQKQFVAIARALSMNARLLVLDEPTASLGSSEAGRLFAVLQDLRTTGTAIVYISHRLREIEALADRAVVLRDGRNAGALQRGELTRDRLVQLMVGRAIDSGPARPARPDAAAGAASASGCPAARRSRAHGALSGRRGVVDGQPRRGARRRGPDRRRALRAGRSDLWRRYARVRARPARRRAARHRLAARRHRRRHLPGARGPPRPRRHRAR